MKLLTSELKQFKSRSSFIKQTNIMPILDYLKFDKGAVTKNNLGSFITQEINCDGSFLIHERVLMNLVDNTTAKEIEVIIGEKNIKISDGSTTLTSPTDNIDLFPKNDKADGEVTTIPEGVMESIAIASKFIVDEDLIQVKMFVFVGNGYVCGSNGVIAYIEKIKDKTPNMVLPKDVVSAIGKYGEVDFSENKSYYFFSSGNCKIGFSKPEFKFYDMTPFGKIPENLPAFSAEKSEIIKFNDICLSSSPSKDKTSSMNLNGKLHLERIDSDFGIEVSKDVEAQGEAAHKFNFNPSQLNTLLKFVPDEMLTFYQDESKYYITGTSGFVSLIMEIK